MSAKQELAGRILTLAKSAAPPDAQKIWDVLTDYQIEYSSKLADFDFKRQIECFASDKRSDGVAPLSLYNYKLQLNLFCDYINKSTVDITVADIRAYIAYMSDVKQYKPNSIQTVTTILKNFFSWLHQEELISCNPALRIKPLHIDRKDTRHPLTPEQLELLRDACQTYREKAIVEFLYSSGCRISEVVQLDLDNLDFVNCEVSVLGKGNKRRLIYFSVRARLMIQCYVRERLGGTALFCGMRSPYNRLGKRVIEQILHQLGVRAGIARNVYPHILRHTLASDLLNAGMDITIIQQLLGHSSVETTQIYAEINQGGVQREYRKFVA